MMVIREAHINDAPLLVPLLEQLGYSGLTTDDVTQKILFYSEPGYKLLLGEDQTLMSFIALHFYPSFHSKGNVGRIVAFCVDEQYRAKGIGSEMLREAESFFRHHQCNRVEVTSNNRRKDAHAFYLKAAYIEDSKKFVKYFKDRTTT
jgi:GNAT superfamily N-acetyltransferase